VVSVIARAHLSAVLDHVRKLMSPRPAEEDSDAGLLARFARGHDGIAFALLMARHGWMVLRVCLWLLMATGHAGGCDPKRVAALIADLESDQFAVRQKAAQELKKLDLSAVPALRAKLKDKPGLEVSKRIDSLLQRAELRIPRAVQVLEIIGDADARKLLQKLAQGSPEARLTQEAKAALERLSKRPAASP
jgi:hypothetical protein